MSGPRQVPIHRALYRPVLLLGCDRGLFIAVVLASLVMGFITINPIGIASAVIFFLVCLHLLRKMGKADPQMRDVYLRRLKYRNGYLPFSRQSRRSKEKGVY